ncbi:hypothetical protein OCOJLMKI_1343 [Methylobacterium iners]|uniref:Uncharacterized protein n=1 Tax=Methylobacterium iners TaxID=418707 RepID=A0ABQ4RTM7_9HYPH|nr:hypothetical protein OCOJLMKI_1343 [Methylobacterium iners]
MATILHALDRTSELLAALVPTAGAIAAYGFLPSL